MTQRQLNRYQVISQVIEGSLSVADAAARLNISNRQVKRLRKGVLADGAEFLIHKNTGLQPIHAFSDDFVNKIVTLKCSDTYANANFLHFSELLAERENTSISYSALHSLLTNAGLKSPMKRRKSKAHHRRKRKAQEGLLIQMDATPFAWFGDGKVYALHGAIDDATGNIVGLFMTKNECLQGYFEVTKQIILSQGIPVNIYADRHAIFLSLMASKLSIEDQLAGKRIPDTQFGRAMKELKVNIIPARSPQAKGRIERLWGTLQSRLPIEFKINNITSMEQANDFLISYIKLFNEKFAIVPSDSVSAYTPLPDCINIDHILCVKHKRLIDNGAVFSYYNKHFKVICDSSQNLSPRAKIDVLLSPSFGVKAHYNGVYYQTMPFIKPKKKTDTVNTDKIPRTYPPLPEDHYLKRGRNNVQKLCYTETDSQILEMLEDILFSKYA